VVIQKNSVQKNWVEFRDASRHSYELRSTGTELSWQLQNNGKKAIRLCKEDFMCAEVSEIVTNPLSGYD
jgi:hypothetical protein